MNAQDHLPTLTQNNSMQAFTFGDPEPVLNTHDLMSMFQVYWNGTYYEPPVSLDGLAKSFRSTPYLSTAIIYKRNQLVSAFKPNKLMSSKAFEQLVMDFLVFGMGYVEAVKSRSNKIVQVTTPLAKYMRRKQDPKEFLMITENWKYHHFERDAVFQVRECDINQEIYGTPEYLAALQSAFLNESATLFRRKYYNNGSHAGFILYLTDPQQSEDDVNNLRQALKDSKGPGNFRNLFLYSPSGKPDGIKLIPVSEVAAKDEFAHIKSITRDDILAAMRTPPQLLGIIPNNTGGFGSITEAEQVHWNSEIIPLQHRIADQINGWIGQSVITFKSYAEIRNNVNTV
ncbi:phage portal protein [uncultured Acinetobacter sp.]|uniref:phage portal protein n=1 Tax=uncultured Acinetobacter sp. TaxID=165433 RepID=UPI00258AED12|nr:phage portal protein [uncultured Acinetobacter sp.]